MRMGPVEHGGVLGGLVVRPRLITRELAQLPINQPLTQYQQILYTNTIQMRNQSLIMQREIYINKMNLTMLISIESKSMKIIMVFVLRQT